MSEGGFLQTYLHDPALLSALFSSGKAEMFVACLSLLFSCPHVFTMAIRIEHGPRRVLVGAAERSYESSMESTASYCRTCPTGMSEVHELRKCEAYPRHTIAY